MNVHESWMPYLSQVGNYFMYPEILKNYYPRNTDVFNVFTMPFNDVKVVILGQDPYPNQGQAIGYAFAVPGTVKKPPSLKIIEQEVGHELDSTLKSWREQGVFLFNTALTVERKRAGSHIEHWKEFTNHVIYSLATVKKPVWMLWGKYAQSFLPMIGNYVYEFPHANEEDKNVVLTASHPAAEAYRRGAGFIGCNHFSKANLALEKKGEKTINW